jgi:hypothetical protein
MLKAVNIVSGSGIAGNQMVYPVQKSPLLPLFT